MYSLFSTKASEAGYRLYTYEVWNWGTFDKEVYQLKPEGETSLLTGANASGKTTMIDGLLTLLVPYGRKRAYNQTAGSKGERTEDSYLLGEYGETENQETQIKETKKLRPIKEKAHSVLLATFKNEDQYVTFAQARWYSGSNLRRAYIVVFKKLEINKDFMPFDSANEWKKRLKKNYPKQGSRDLVHISDSPGDYARLMQKTFGFRSEKAHTLFSQTVGLKVLGDLNAFVRNKMLEVRDSEGEFNKIKIHFKTLTDAFNAIEKAKEQILLLHPIQVAHASLAALESDQIHYQNHFEVLPFWFAKTKYELATKKIQTYKNNYNNIIYKAEKIDDSLYKLDQEKLSIATELSGDQVGRKIQDLEKDNRANLKELKLRNKQYDKLIKLFGKIDLDVTIQHEEDFNLIMKEVKKRKINHQKEADKNYEDEIKLQIKKQHTDTQYNDIKKLLETLIFQKNKVVGRVVDIRKEIIKEVGCSEEMMPFVAELIQVKKKESAWEYAIEKLLYGFAMRMLIPDQYYQAVTQYVNTHDLKGRLVFEKVNLDHSNLNLFNTISEDSLIKKLEFKNGVYHDWIKYTVEKRYDYLCFDDLEKFRLSDKAITKAGLIKNKARHEKDDRLKGKSRQQYILGWNNEEKVLLLKEDLQQLAETIEHLDTTLKQFEKRRLNFQTTQENYTKILSVERYDQVDYKTLANLIESNKEEIIALKKTSNHIQVLKDKLEEVEKLIRLRKEERDEIKKQINTTDSNIKELQNIILNTKDVLDKEAYDKVEGSPILKTFEETWIKKPELLDLNNIESSRINIRDKVTERINNIKVDYSKNKSEVEKLMRQFKNPTPQLLKRFPDWMADTHRLPEDGEHVQEYLDLLFKIEKNELVDYREKFKKYLNEEMITKMSDFQAWLNRQENDIEDNILNLNDALESIDFKNNPKTFIQLHTAKDYSPRVKEFRVMLNTWKPDLKSFYETEDLSILETSYLKIKALLDKVGEDESYRKEVLDVRNWLKFTAKEHYREDRKKIHRSYTGTAKLSGGEGAQLTYTILGSAIAHQFGIHNDGLNPNSFRFICVDEAFSKQDDEKAEFLMKLCQQLNLQLMVVSPAKAEEIKIVEKYIARVHFVQRFNNKNSVVYDMPIMEFKKSIGFE